MPHPLLFLVYNFPGNALFVAYFAKTVDIKLRYGLVV